MPRSYDNQDDLPAVSLNTALEDYYELRLYRLAPNTRKAHEGLLERMRTWLVGQTQPQLPLSIIDERLMNRFYQRLLPPNLAEITYNSYRQYGNLFFKFCQGEGWIRRNPMRHVDPLRVPAKHRLILSPDELLGLLDGASPRDRVALALGMNTALRAGDLARLKIGMVNLGNDTVAVQIQKTAGVELLPVTAELRAELLRWYESYADAMGVDWQMLPNAWTLVPPAHQVAQKGGGRRLTYCPDRVIRHPEVIVQRALARLGHDTKGEGFHTLRRSTLRALHDLAAADGNAVPIRVAQALAGHKSQQTTERYLGITHERQLRDRMLQGQAYLTRAAERQQETHQEGRSGVRAIG